MGLDPGKPWKFHNTNLENSERIDLKIRI